jgi:hypothetical protein
MNTSKPRVKSVFLHPEDIVMCSSASTMPSCGSILNYICPYLIVTKVTPTELLQLSCRFNPRASQRLYLNDDESLMNSHISAIDPTVVFIHGFTQTAESLSASTVRDGKLLNHIGVLVATSDVHCVSNVMAQKQKP